MTKYRKKPVVIEAWQFNGDTNQLPAWLDTAAMNGKVWREAGAVPVLTISTLEGHMKASIGDWIIRGVQGELYPCKPDIFAATYELADEVSP